VVTITGPQTAAYVTVPGGVKAGTMVFALAQTNIAGVGVASAVPDPATGKATINLNVRPPSGVSVKIAWFALG
jgi:hypothetical protein